MPAQLQSDVYQTGKQGIAGVLLTIVLLAAIWWVLTDGATASLLVGLPAVAGAAWAAKRISEGICGFSGLSVSLMGLAGFVPFFLWESLRGGADVALRTLAPKMRVRPGFQRYRMELQIPAARTFFANCVSLLPGTLAADLQGEWLEVHVLNVESDSDAELRRLERSVARLLADPRVAT